MNMPMIRAIYENGVFRPLEPVDIPEGTRVEVSLTVCRDEIPANPNMSKIYEILSERFNSGFTDTAERHNEHQP
jgi:predicted DNA-binding antitoxin AbrB/MazE fold protein